MLENEGDKNNNFFGNLKILINEESDDLFQRIGKYDLIITKQITFYDYINGFKFKLKLPDDNIIEIKNDDPSNNGLLVIYKNYGFYHNYNSEERGNLIIKYVIINNINKEKIYDLFGSNFM